MLNGWIFATNQILILKPLTNWWWQRLMWGTTYIIYHDILIIFSLLHMINTILSTTQVQIIPNMSIKFLSPRALLSLRLYWGAHHLWCQPQVSLIFFVTDLCCTIFRNRKNNFEQFRLIFSSINLYFYVLWICRMWLTDHTFTINL